MKNLLFLLLFAGVLAACGGDDEATPEKTGTCLRVEIDGEVFETENVTYNVVTNTIDSSGVDVQDQLYTVTAVDVSAGAFSPRTFVIIFGCIGLRDQAESDAQSVECGLEAGYIAGSLTAPESFSSNGTNGRLRITTANEERIAGTFSFVLEDDFGSGEDINATDGSFSIEL